MIPPDYCAEQQDLLPCLAEAGLFRCASCNACRSNCAMHAATNRLKPLELVRTAGLGMLQQALLAPELWYCLQCNRCSEGCPMMVKPSVLIRALRREAVRRGLVGLATLERFEELQARLQRARWHMIDHFGSGIDPAAFAAEYDTWARTPVEARSGTVPVGGARGASLRDALESRLGFASDLSACMTCGECTTACPVTHQRAVYDPVMVFRMANLGMESELLASPSLWMCLGCGACTQACAQGVRGHLIVRALQELAVERGVVPEDMSRRLWECDHVLFPCFLREVDELFGHGGEPLGVRC